MSSMSICTESLTLEIASLFSYIFSAQICAKKYEKYEIGKTLKSCIKMNLFYKVDAKKIKDNEKLDENLKIK